MGSPRELWAWSTKEAGRFLCGLRDHPKGTPLPVPVQKGRQRPRMARLPGLSVARLCAATLGVKAEPFTLTGRCCCTRCLPTACHPAF